MILDPETPEDDDLEDPRFLEIYQEAMDLYGLIHSRFIVSPKGLSLMKEKFLNGAFGTCPRVLCTAQNVVPIGLSENLKNCRIKVYCPLCQEVYFPKKKCSDIDGAYFGSSFPHILYKNYPDILPKDKKISYEPRIYGFRILGLENDKLN